MKARGARLLVAGASRGVRLWSMEEAVATRSGGNNSINFSMEDEMSFNAPVRHLICLIVVVVADWLVTLQIIAAAFDDTLDMGIVGTTAGTLWYLDWTNRSIVRMVTGHSGKVSRLLFLSFFSRRIKIVCF